MRTTAIVALVAIAFIAVVAARPKWHELTAEYTYTQYLHDFGKKYKTEAEMSRRAKNFAASLKSVLEHNNGQPSSSYKRGVNHLSDWDEEELQRIRGGRHDPYIKGKYGKPYVRDAAAEKAVAPTLDFRTASPPVLTAIKDQGQCGDCWAHSVVEAIESSYALATGELFVLSQQQVTSCTPQAGSCYSCEGSFPTLGFDYVVEAGITEEWIYSFQSYQDAMPTCNPQPFISTPINTIVNMSGYVNVGANSQGDFLAAMNNLGPLSILVDASGWPSYESGIYDGCDYSQNISLDHAVQVIGYGTENSTDYWIVRNSWAPSWGESGYIRLHKSDAPSCGWNQGAQHTYGCYGVGPSATWACGQCGILYHGAFPTVIPNV